MSDLLAVVALAAALAAAVVRDRRAPEPAVALGAAAVLVATGVIGRPAVRDEAAELAPTLAFLAALLALGEGCERGGLFEALAARMSRAAMGSPRRLLRVVVVAAALVTAVLGLDATVVLLTPAVLAAAMRARVPPRPAAYACTHLANAGSLLLPVSNLTNLLAFHAIDVSFLRFAGLMALPWLSAVAIGVASAAAVLSRRADSAGAARARGARDPITANAACRPRRHTGRVRIVVAAGFRSDVARGGRRSRAARAAAATRGGDAAGAGPRGRPAAPRIRAWAWRDRAGGQ